MTVGNVGSNVFSMHPERSRDLAYTSLLQDEQARFAHPLTIPKLGRDHNPCPPNGNLRVTIPNIDKAEVRSHMTQYQIVNTNTRTVFNTDRTYDLHDSIADKVSSATFRNSVMKVTGHLGMATMPPTDPRQQHMSPPTAPALGPGCYEPDALRRTGSPEAWAMDLSHRTLPLHKDPGRPSAAFKTPGRNETMDEVNLSKRQEGQPTYFLPPDYSSWTAKGMHMPKNSRVIQAERWGHSLREPRPPPDQLSQRMEDPQVDKTGHASTCAAYALDPLTPGARAAFGSAEPRVMARHSNRKQDTRLKIKSWDKVATSGTALGPGSFQTDVVRFKSHHKAHLTSRRYISQGDSIFPEDKIVRIRTATASGSRPATTGSINLPLGTAASSPSSPSQAAFPLPPDLTEALSSPFLSPQVRAPAPWDSPISPGLPSPSICSPLHSPTRCVPAHTTMLGDLLPNMPQPLPEPKTTHSPGLGRIKLDTNLLLEHDWAIHAYVVAAAYANVHELRGAATTGHASLASPRLAPTSPSQGTQVHLPDDVQLKLQQQPRTDSAPGLIRKQAGSIWEPDGTAMKLLENQMQGHLSWGLNPRLAGIDTTRWLQVSDDSDGRTMAMEHANTAPTSPTIWSPQAAQLAAFNEQRQHGIPLELNTRLPGDETLSFLRRNRPHKELIKQQLKAIGELKAERKKCKEEEWLQV